MVFALLQASAKANSVGGLSYLATLDDGLPEIPAITHYVEKLRDATMRRRIIFAAQHLASMATDDLTPLSDVMDRFSSSIADVVSVREGSRPISTSEMLELHGPVELLKPRQQTGIPLAWPELQDALGGLEGGQMIVLMAATSRGKTSMALQMATSAATSSEGVPVIWTMEMSPKANFQRMVTQLSGVYATKPWATAEERSAHMRAVETLDSHKIYFDSTSRSVSSFLAGLRHIRVKQKLGLVIVDHLQLIRSENPKNRAQEVSENSRALKLAAMDFNVPFLVLSQVDRSSVKGEGKIGLHSAKESGDVENDADVVMWIDSPEFSRVQPTCVSLWIGKQREGPTGFSIPMVFQPEISNFYGGAKTWRRMTRKSMQMRLRQRALTCFTLSRFLKAHSALTLPSRRPSNSRRPTSNCVVSHKRYPSYETRSQVHLHVRKLFDMQRARAVEPLSSEYQIPICDAAAGLESSLLRCETLRGDGDLPGSAARRLRRLPNWANSRRGT